MAINTVVIVYSIVFLYNEHHLIQKENILRLGAYGAYLIVSTISDLVFFMIMVLIIILTFANFFYIINFNAKS